MAEAPRALRRRQHHPLRRSAQPRDPGRQPSASCATCSTPSSSSTSTGSRATRSALFPIKSADVKSLMADLDKVFGPGGSSPLAGIVRVIPIERMNALLVRHARSRVTSRCRQGRGWSSSTRRAATTGGARFFVYTVRNGKAENLAQLVGDLFSRRGGSSADPSLAPGSRPAEIRSSPFASPMGSSALGGTPTRRMRRPLARRPRRRRPLSPSRSRGRLGPDANEVRVIADKDTNSLLILATPVGLRGDRERAAQARRDPAPGAGRSDARGGDTRATSCASASNGSSTTRNNTIAGASTWAACPHTPQARFPSPRARFSSW